MQNNQRATTAAACTFLPVARTPKHKKIMQPSGQLMVRLNITKLNNLS
jgi:hypothetical protein